MSDAFSKAKGVEARGLTILLPYIEQRATDGRYVVTSKGRLAKHLQETVGDVILNVDYDRMFTVEIKVEQKHTGNLFLETWSNRNLDDRSSHAERGSNPGWMLKQRADLLFYYFLDADTLYIIHLFTLQQWAFGHSSQEGQIYEFKECRQGKYIQRNDTWGRLVPVRTVKEALGSKTFQVVHPQQIPLFEGAA